MTTATVPAPLGTPAAPAVEADDYDGVWRLSVDQYHAMIGAGILTSDDPVELLEGVLVQKMPKNPAHVMAKCLLVEALRKIIPTGWFVREQDPVTTTDSEPEPDTAVVRGSPRHYVERHPGPEDAALIVEVADSSLRRDRGQKKRLYARANVREYWIVSLVDRQVEVFANPTGPGRKPDYRQRREYKAIDSVPVVIDGREVGRLTVADLLP
jgi:Uma2 family endonuclease